MEIEKISGFENYTDEIITELRHLFGEEKIDSRPIKHKNVILWLDANQRLHRKDFPAVERKNGEMEFWVHGRKK